MSDEHRVYPLGGKFGETEAAILICLYERSDGTVGTREITKILKPDQTTPEEQQRAYEEIQRGIENLIVARLIRGKRVPESGIVYHHKLRLTPRGEAEAIVEQNRPKSIVLDIPRPQWAKES